MIVISTYNGMDFLPLLLADLKEFNIPNEKICIVENKSTQQPFLDYLETLKIENYHVLHNPESTYELGALNYALDNLSDDVWFLLQDSFRITENIFELVTPKLTKDNVYTMLTFPMHKYDSDPEANYLKEHYGTIYYSVGMFASIIFALDEVVRKVKPYWVLPRDKLGDCTTERGVSIIFDRCNISIIGLDVFNPQKVANNEYTFFKKTFGGRQ